MTGKRKTCLLILLLATTTLHALERPQTTSVYTALKTTGTVQTLGMANAGTAIAQGTASFSHNPAGLAHQGTQYQYNTLDQGRDATQDFFSHSLYNGPLGISYVRLNENSGIKTDVTQVGFAYDAGKGITWGLTYKFINSESENKLIRGNSADFGIKLKFTESLRVGLMAQDLGTTGLGNDLNTTIKAGAAYTMLGSKLTLITDVLTSDIPSRDRFATLHTGIQYNLTDSLILRTGAYKNHWTAGFSLENPAFGLHYAIDTPSKESKTEETLHRVSVSLGPGVLKSKENRARALYRPKAYAVFRVDGSIIDGKSEFSLLGGKKLGSNDLLKLIHDAAHDPTCEGFIIRIGGLGSNLATIAFVQELRSEIKKAQKKGKRVIVYIESWATLSSYYLASAADKIVTPELATISQLGLQLEVVKTKRFLGKWGFEQETIASGKYKDATQPLSGPMSNDAKLQLDSVLNDSYHHVLFDIKTERKLNWEDVGGLFDGRLVSATTAKDAGLIDALGYWEAAIGLAGEGKGGTDNVKTAPITSFTNDGSLSSIFDYNKKIAIIEIDGAIHLGKNKENFLFGGKSTGADEIHAVLEKIKKSPSIKAVIMRINSPGGSLIGSDRIYQSLLELKKEGKKVYTSMGTIAASGGYYIALASDKIYANPGTLTGSIGVISNKFSSEEFNKKYGIDVETFKTGKYMTMTSSNHKLTEEEKKLWQDYQKSNYKAFLNKVIKHRKLDPKKATELAQGQIFTGNQAKSESLIDEIGTLYDTIAALKTELNISAEPDLIYYRPNNKTSQLFNLIR